MQEGALTAFWSVPPVGLFFFRLSAGLENWDQSVLDGRWLQKTFWLQDRATRIRFPRC